MKFIPIMEKTLRSPKFTRDLITMSSWGGNGWVGFDVPEQSWPTFLDEIGRTDDQSAANEVLYDFGDYGEIRVRLLKDRQVN